MKIYELLISMGMEHKIIIKKPHKDIKMFED